VEEGKIWKDNLNADSLRIISAYVEPGLAAASQGDKFQFERMGYFCVDKDSNSSNLVFNRTTTLKDNWVKQSAKG
jgi:glutaminyl-tRNA synthetase